MSPHEGARITLTLNLPTLNLPLLNVQPQFATARKMGPSPFGRADSRRQWSEFIRQCNSNLPSKFP